MRQAGLIAAAAVAVGLGAGCASKTRFEPAELKNIRSSEVAIDKQWSRDIGAVGSDTALRPLVAAGRVFVADRKGRIRALDAAGKTLWNVDTDKRLGAGPALVDGQLIVGGRDGDLIAVAAASGEILWSRLLSSEVATQPAGDSSLLVVKTEDGRVHGLGPTDGAEKWVAPLTVPSLTWRGNAPLQLQDDAVLVATSTGRLKALSREDGALLWEQSIADPSGRSEVERLTDVDGDLLMEGPVVVAVSTAGTLKVLRQDGGQLIWERGIGGFTGATIDENCLYVVDKQDFVSCLDARSGAAVWTNEDLQFRRLTAARPWKGNVLIGDFDGYVHVLSAASGSIIARQRVARSAVTWLTEGPDGGLLALAAGGDLVQLDTHPLGNTGF